MVTTIGSFKLRDPSAGRPDEANGWRPEAPGCVFKDAPGDRSCSCAMPNRPDSCGSRGREYRVWPNYIELRSNDPRYTAERDTDLCTVIAKYCGELEKVAHAYMCYELGLPYDGSGPPMIELRTTKLETQCSARSNAESGAVLRACVIDLRWLGNDRFRVRMSATINERTRIDFESCGVLSESARFVAIRRTA